jgi:DNA (cytosine-5)-methyltransferase 1
MSNIGYNNYYKVLNAKDFGIPQNRERVFTISIRKDIDKGFEFPKPIELKLRLKDLLETKVDEKFYLKDEIVDRFVLKDSTLTSTDYKQPKQILQIGTLDIKGNDQIRRVYETNGISPSLTTMAGGNTQPKILESKNLKLSNNFKIRKLTPRECWRLMGFSDKDFEKAAKVCSNSQLYKQAGNSIVVNVLVNIFNNLEYLFR